MCIYPLTQEKKKEKKRKYSGKSVQTEKSIQLNLGNLEVVWLGLETFKPVRFHQNLELFMFSAHTDEV
jgi:hypothetical protein